MTKSGKADPAQSMTPEMAAIAARLAAEDAHLPDPTTLPPSVARKQIEGINTRWNTDLPAMAAVDRTTVPAADGTPAPVVIFTPPDAGPGAVIYIHGGGFAFCSPTTHERAMRCLAIECGMPVIGIRYALAPEAPFPAGLNDVAVAWQAIGSAPAHYGINGGPVGVAGDSAGANLALALMLQQIRSGGALPDFGLLFYGVYGCDFDTPSYRSRATGYGLTRQRMQQYWDWYCPDHERRNDPLATPLAAEDSDLRRLPPLYLNAAGLDPLLDDSLSLHARLTGIGREDPLVIHDGVIHGFMQMTHSLAEARDAFRQAGAWCRRNATKTNPWED
ncbi:alpha/beta hydrolase [Fodinicurvata sp. EGI_FJ10296]|uniref:alpha/beta hydrolase n=1 Tax=Fodinicurvata sp. EGI_FJ10296 TaxID=3231908 RepID=UPI00345662CD